MASSSSGSSLPVPAQIPTPNSLPPPTISISTTIPGSALASASTCVEYQRLVGKIMRDNFWDLDPFTVGLNPGLLNFEKEFIRSKKPHIKAKVRLLARILGRMVDDEHLLLVTTNPNMYRPHPNRSTIDYLVIGDDPPWIPHFFNGSLAYPHVEDAMNSIQRFLDSEGSKPPSRVPTVGVSRASTFAISRFKTEELPSCEEYIDFVHAVVQSASADGLSGTIREDSFFPSMAVTPVAEVRKRANLVARLMGRMVEDDVLTRVSPEDGTYVLHPDCRPRDYMADRGLTDVSHWVWTFKTWAVLDQVAEKAVTNLDKFLRDLSPAERSRVKLEREDTPPPSKLETEHDDDDDVVFVKQEETAPKNPKKPTPKPRRQKHKRTDRDVSSSSSSSGSDQSPVISLLTPSISRTPRETTSDHESEEDFIMESIELPDENSSAAIQLRENVAYSKYFEAVPGKQRGAFTTMAPRHFKNFHEYHPNDAFEVTLEQASDSSYVFQIICHDCDCKVATKYEGSISNLGNHLKANSHVANVMSKLERLGEVPIETVETKKRMKVPKKAPNTPNSANLRRDQNHNSAASASASSPVPVPVPAPGPTLPLLSKQPRPPATSTSTSISFTDFEDLQVKWGLPQKAFKYVPPHPRQKAGMEGQRSTSDHGSTSPAQSRPPNRKSPSLLRTLPSSQMDLRSPTPSTSPSPQPVSPLDTFRSETIQRLDTLEASNKRKRVKLDHYGTLLGETNSKYGEVEQNVSVVNSRVDDLSTTINTLKNAVTNQLEPILEAIKDVISSRQQAPNEMIEQLDMLLGRDETHESRYEELKSDIGSVLNSIEALKTLDSRLQGLESSKIQTLEAQNELEQEHRVMNARFGLLEQNDSLDEPTELITAISSRVEDLETARSRVLAATETLDQNLSKLLDRVTVVEEDNLNVTNLVDDIQGSLGSINESVDALKQQTDAQGVLLDKLAKREKKWNEFFERLKAWQKAQIEGIQGKQTDEAQARQDFEKRMEKRFEEMSKEHKEKEDKMAERIRSLEKKEERTSKRLEILKTYGAQPGSMAGSESGASTPSSSAQKGTDWNVLKTAVANPPRPSGTPRPILPPNITNGTPRPSSQMGGNTGTGTATLNGRSPRSLQSAPMDESSSDSDAPTFKYGPQYPLEGKFIDARDKREILNMSEIERERTLAERAQQIEQDRQSRALQQLLKSRRAEDKKNKKRKAGAADASEDPRKAQRQPSKLGGSSQMRGSTSTPKNNGQVPKPPQYKKPRKGL